MTIDEYIGIHIDEEPPLLKKLWRDANVNLLYPRMLSGHAQGRFLKMIVQMIAPRNILEIGTFTGYSALCMAEGLDAAGAVIHTIEINDEMEDFILKYIDLSGYGERIKLHIGDALEIIPRFSDSLFDMVFIDADKRLYREYLELALPKVRKGGFLLADNTLWDGKVLGKPSGNDWQTKGILDFNDKLKNDKRVEKVILPIRDGLTLIRKL